MFWDLLGGFWVALGAPWGRPKGLLSVHWGLLGVSWCVLGVSWVAFASPGGSLGGSVVLQGVFWGVVGAFLGRPSGEAVPT